MVLVYFSCLQETPSISPIAAVIPDAQPSPSTSEGSTPVTSGDSPLLPSVPTPRPVAKKAGWRLWTPGFAGGGKKVKQLAGVSSTVFTHLMCMERDVWWHCLLAVSVTAMDGTKRRGYGGVLCDLTR